MIQQSTSIISDLRRFLKDQLPEYMVPDTFVILDALPLTPSGKVDRQALPVPKDLRSQLEVAYVMPQTKAERLLASIWQEVLNLEEVGIHDNFFDLGGHSLLLPQVLSQLRIVFHRDLKIVKLFEYSTIASLAEYLEKEEAPADETNQTQKRAEARKQAMLSKRKLK